MRRSRTLVDAYGLVSFLIGGPGAAEVRAILRSGEAVVATGNLAETLDVAERIHGLPIQRAAEILDPLFEAVIDVVPLDSSLARRAAEIRAREYHRERRPISLADSILIATAETVGRLATADPHVLAIARERGIEAVDLIPRG
ncbi:MAG TPA: PIN domain-containing protein [Candidatus Binatia bacterium]|nr:PIN domain-containing protein [Candidatus Binatia bacterium]